MYERLAVPTMRLRVVLPRIPVRFPQSPGVEAGAPPPSPASEPPDALLPLLPDEEAASELEEPPDEVPEPPLPDGEVDVTCEPLPEDVPSGTPDAPVSGTPDA
jgi:hypothetical protein